MRELSLPLGIYLAVTLVGPALNGGFARPDFAAHAAWTAGTVAAFAGLVALIRAWCGRRSSNTRSGVKTR